MMKDEMRNKSLGCEVSKTADIASFPRGDIILVSIVVMMTPNGMLLLVKQRTD